MTIKTKCKCSLTHKLQGDGCEICNPELALVHIKLTTSLLKRKIKRLEKELEIERVRLSICSVVAMANTRDSAENVRQIKTQYWCKAYEDVCMAVDSQISLREQLDYVLNYPGVREVLPKDYF